MIELYEGVEYRVTIPSGDVNQKIKEVIREAKKKLGCRMSVSLVEEYKGNDGLDINIGDYFLSFTTPGFKASWEKEDIESTGYKIKEIMEAPVYIQTHGPYVYCISVNGEEKYF